MKVAFSSQSEQVLREQPISENQPGGILFDFEVFLDFIVKHTLAASGVNELLPLTSLRELNALLTKPLDIALQRSVQKSFPNISGLFLLGRARGLLVLQSCDKGKKVFAIDETALMQWRGLNPTERYFTLLEAWIVRGSEELLGEHHGGGMYNDALYKLVRLFEKTPKEGLKIEGNKT